MNFSINSNTIIITGLLCFAIALVLIIDFVLRRKNEENSELSTGQKNHKKRKISPFYSKGFIRLHIVVISGIIIYFFGNLAYIDGWEYLFTKKVSLGDTRYYDDAVIYLGIYLCLFLFILPFSLLLFNWIKDGFTANSSTSKKRRKLSIRQKGILITSGSILFLFIMFYLISSFYLPNYYYETGDCKKANAYYKIFNSGEYKKCSNPGYWNERRNKWQRIKRY